MLLPVTRLLVVFACVLAFRAAASPSAASGQAPPDLSDGRTLFNTYCASCHGTSATGSGPLAPALRHVPPDLTGLALANGGVFPSDRLRRIVDGREVQSHGNREMPVWGDAFKSIRGGYTEDAVQARIAAILKYLETIQRRRA
jgi:mono/diheme cytochrome c family protein